MGGTTVSGSVTVGGQKFNYAEEKTSDAGGGPRGIKISAEGVADSQVLFYEITPNPHNNGKYNDGGQAAFYKAMADHITKGYKFDDSDVKTTTLLKKGDSPPGIKDWNKLKLPEQVKKVADYNQKATEANKKALLVAKGKQIKAHLKAAGGTSVSWGGENYKLPAAK